MQSEYERLISQLPPGSKVCFITVELPHAGGNRPAVRTPASGVVVLPSARAPERRMGTSNSPSSGAAETNDDMQLSALRQKYGADAALKPREWRDLTSLSEREIERAIQNGALPASAKGDGRDHAAHTVTIDAMEAYLATVKAVEARAMAPPPWWDAVRKSGIRCGLSQRKSA